MLTVSVLRSILKSSTRTGKDDSGITVEKTGTGCFTSPKLEISGIIRFCAGNGSQFSGKMVVNAETEVSGHRFSPSTGTLETTDGGGGGGGHDCFGNELGGGGGGPHGFFTKKCFIK